MRRAVIFACLSAISLVSAPAPAQDVAPDRKIVGPALVCGEASALRLRHGETMVRRDPDLDFLLYYVEGADGPFLLYEGNAPQAHDDEVQTGLSFPSVIAIHDNRSAASKSRSRIRDRLRTGAARTALCPGSSSK